MKKYHNFLAESALVSRLRVYYTLLPKGYMDTLVGMAMACSTKNPPDGEPDKGYSPGGLVIKEDVSPIGGIQ
jgi:hypothetical protein